MLGRTITGKCPQCGDEIHPAKTQEAFNRTLGLHMRNKHGIVGKWRSRGSHHKNGTMESDITKAAEEKRRLELKQYKRDWWQRNKNRLATKPKQTAEERKEYQRQYRLKRKQMAAPAAPTAQVDPCKLSECPHCGTRFYMIKGQ